MNSSRDAKRRERERKHHHGHHHRLHSSDLYAGSNACVWVLLFIVLAMLAVWIVGALVYPWQQTVIVEEDGTPFVFRKRVPFAEKRSRRGLCTVGEQWDGDLGMCAPVFNAPLALEHSIMNATVPACNSFFESMCGKWNAHHTNEDRTFSYGYHRNQRLVQKLIENAPLGSPIAQFHRSCLDVQRGAPVAVKESELELRHVLETIVGDLKSYADLPSVLGRLARHGYGGPFVLSIERHPLERDSVLPFFAPDETFSGFDTPHITAVYERTRHLTHYDSLYMMDRIRRAHKIVAALNEHNQGRAQESGLGYEDYVREGYFTNDTIKYAALPRWHTPYEDAGAWNSYLQSLDGSGLRFAQAQDVWVADLDFMRWLMKEALPQFELLHWRSYIEFSILYHSHQFLPALVNNVYLHRIPRHALVNASHSPPCYAIVQHMLAGHVARAFLDSQPASLLAQQKQQVRTMTVAIIERFTQLVRGTSWLRDADAKEAALLKLTTMRVRVAEPDEWEVEPFGPRIAHDRYDHNMNLVRRYRVHRNLQQWHKTSADVLFAAPLTDVNAFYSPHANSITILAGLLQPPFYSEDYDELSKYAIMGSIIGHELGHALDAHGLLWDAAGRLTLNSIFGNDTASMAGFATQIRCVIDEFGPTPAGCNDTLAYGLSTLNEDLADLTGVRLAFHAFFDAHPELGQGAKQHFFMVFAQVWCASYDANHKCEAVQDDVHALAEYRVDHTLRNLAEFQAAFQCHTGNAMHREQVCAVYGSQ